VATLFESRQKLFTYPETVATGEGVNGVSCLGARVTREAEGRRVEGEAVTGDAAVGKDAIGAEVMVMLGALVVNRKALGAVEVVGREVSESPVDGEGVTIATAFGGGVNGIAAVDGAGEDTVGIFCCMETTTYFGVNALAATSLPTSMV
jgi:hypothetical protein